MPVLAYGVTAADFPHPDLTGVDGRAVELAPADDLAVPFTRLATPPTHPSACQAVAYAQAVSGLHAAGTLVPFRFGAVAACPGRLAELVCGKAATFRELLWRLDGTTEMAVRVAWDRAAAAALGRLGRRARETVSGWIRAAVPSVREATATRVGGTAGGLAVHCLVPKSAVDVFRHALATDDRLAALSLVVTGPWPPYTFAAAAVPVVVAPHG